MKLLSLDEADPRDLIDNYLLEIKKGRDGFSKDELYGILFDLFAAGSETTSTTLRLSKCINLFSDFFSQVGNNFPDS